MKSKPFIYAVIPVLLFACINLQAQIEQNEIIDPMSLDLPSALKIKDIRFEETELPRMQQADRASDPEMKNGEIDGFRVQLISTQDVALAESVEKRALELFSGEVYLIFDYPNYKVRVGNYLEIKEAAPTETLARRNGFPRAWIVPSEIIYSSGSGTYR